MRFLRTANAGGLITLDGVRISLDGVCGEVAPYLQTPKELREYLQENVPDAVGFTHLHPDHFHPGYRDFCVQTGTVLLMPGTTKVQVGEVEIHPVETRHLGKVEPDLVHNSFLLNGSKRILFVGDASPSSIHGISNVDIMIAPYAYITSSAGIKAVISTGARHLVLVHMPGIDPDPYGLWDGVRAAISQCTAFTVCIPQMGEEIEIA